MHTPQVLGSAFFLALLAGSALKAKDSTSRNILWVGAALALLGLLIGIRGD
jgi:hypothetical protein